MTAAFRLTEGTVALDDDVMGTVYVASLPEGPIRGLAATGRVIWHELTAVSDVPWRRRVADRFDLPWEQIEDDVEGFVDELVALGLIERAA